MQCRTGLASHRRMRSPAAGLGSRLAISAEGKGRSDLASPAPPLLDIGTVLSWDPYRVPGPGSDHADSGAGHLQAKLLALLVLPWPL